MLLSALIAAVAAATQAAAFTVPHGQPDGVYQVVIHPDGTEEHLLIDTIDNASINTRNEQIEARENLAEVPNYVGCYGTAGPLSIPDTDAANNALDAQCSHFNDLEPKTSFYSKSGCVVAYFCNWDAGWRCYPGTRQDWSRRITAQCGNYIGGWAEYDDWDNIHYSYGYQDFCQGGNNFCAF
ncbi:hypothetical protein Sste5346_000826 [Sporothrix stenoceras]|uniref:Uncharacterized protein n=1 Tax=Sporothrix stenoceras TaxID=5173 RepID=A0ABR3ZU30_9PEZI